MNTFKDDLNIDPNALDVEWLEQPAKFFDVAEQSAEAKRDMERAKLAVDVVEAELDNEIRTNPGAFGIAKVTEGAITSTIKVHPKYQEAVNKHIEAQYTHNMLSAATQAWDQRKRALENLVTLHGQSYFAGPSVPRNLPKEQMSMREKKAIRNPSKEE